MLVPSRAARRYAKALFGLAQETGQMDAIKDDLSALQALTSRSSEFARFVGDYRLPRQVRETLLASMFSSRLQPLSLRFLMFLETKRRLGLLGAICTSFGTLHDSMNGIVRGRLTSAFALDSADVMAISTRAEAKGQGRLRLDVAVDADLLGGFKLRVGDVVRDLSVAGQLRLLRRTLVYG